MLRDLSELFVIYCDVNFDVLRCGFVTTANGDSCCEGGRRIYDSREDESAQEMHDDDEESLLFVRRKILILCLTNEYFA